MQRLTANQQLSTLIAIKAAMSQGKRFEAICSELMERSEGAVADAWQRCEMELREGNDYSKSLAATELFDDGVLSILMLANDCECWSIAIDAAINYLTLCFSAHLPIQTSQSGAAGGNRAKKAGNALLVLAGACFVALCGGMYTMYALGMTSTLLPYGLNFALFMIPALVMSGAAFRAVAQRNL